MHYRHAYHAGNFADVFKHTVLCGLLMALSRKDKPWLCLDTHAGAGSYDLAAAPATATGEAADGIARLVNISNPPEPLASYLRLVARENPAGVVQRYPGSPCLIEALMREGDRLVCCESVEDVAAELKASVPVATVHLRDGYETVSLLPPAEKRGLVFVDAPFERRDEFEAMVEFVTKAQARFAQGIYALWYPLKNGYDAERFRRRLARASSRPVLDCRLDTGALAAGQMRGCGLALVNPPFRFETEIAESLNVIARELAMGPRASAEVIWLKTEAECAA